MNHRIEMEFNKLLQMAASGSLQQVQLQRKRLQTLDRSQELSQGHWSKIDLLIALRQRDSQRVMEILQQVDAPQELQFASMEPALRLAPESISLEFLEWCEAVLAAGIKKSPAKSKGPLKLGAFAAVLVPIVALLAVVFGRGWSSTPETIFELDSQELVARVTPATMLYVQGVSFMKEDEEGTLVRGWAPYSRGSAWSITPTRFITNRHVVEEDDEFKELISYLREAKLRPSVESYVFPVVSSISEDMPHPYVAFSGGYVVAVPVGSLRLSGDHDLATGQGLNWTFDVTCEISSSLSQGQKISAVGFPAEADDLLQWSVNEGLGPEQFAPYSFNEEQKNVVAIASSAFGPECFFPSILDGRVSKLHETLPTFSHTAPAGSGASGSPIFDEYARVVGVVTAGSTSGGLATANNIALRASTIETLFD